MKDTGWRTFCCAGVMSRHPVFYVWLNCIMATWFHGTVLWFSQIFLLRLLAEFTGFSKVQRMKPHIASVGQFQCRRRYFDNIERTGHES